MNIYMREKKDAKSTIKNIQFVAASFISGAVYLLEKGIRAVFSKVKNKHGEVK